MSQTIAYTVASLLEKMDNSDGDLRYMGLSDLKDLLQAPESSTLDDMACDKIYAALMKRLDDEIDSVRDLETNCLELMMKVSQKPILTVIGNLSSMMNQDENKKLREAAVFNLKTVINNLDQSVGQLICKDIVTALSAMVNDELSDIQKEILGLLSDTVSKFGNQIPKEQQASILTTQLCLLKSSQSSLRKGAGSVVSSLAKHLDEDDFQLLINHLVSELSNENATDKSRTLVLCTNSLSRCPRLCNYIPEFMPILQALATSSEDIELRAECLSTIEAFISNFPKESAQYIDGIVKHSLNLLKYNPNLAVDEDEEEEETMDEADDEDDNSYYSDHDDDDTSFKVRRNAGKLLAAIIEAYPDLMQTLHETVAPVLISRFKETEETVRTTIMETYIALLRQTNAYCNESPIAADAAKEIVMDFRSPQSDITYGAKSKSCERVKHLLQDQVPGLSLALQKQLVSPFMLSCERNLGFDILRELVVTLRGGLAEEIGLFMPAIQSSLGASNRKQQQQVLAFLYLLLQCHAPNVFQPYLDRLCPAVLQVISDSQALYQAVSDAFLVCLELIKVMRPIYRKGDSDTYDITPMNDAFKPYLLDIFKVTTKTLSITDADQVVKKQSIVCLGRLLAQTGDVLKSEQSTAWGILIERLQNEVTRVTALMTLAGVSQSPVVAGEGLQDCVNAAISEIIGFLRRSDQELRITSLECLTLFLTRFGSCIPRERLSDVLVALNPLASTKELRLLPLALQAAEVVITTDKSLAVGIGRTVLPDLLKLAQSPLLHGAALSALLQLIATAVKANPNDYQFLVDELVKPFLTPEYTQTNAKDAIDVAITSTTVSQCLGVLAENIDDQSRNETIARFLGYINNGTGLDATMCLSLLTLGEIGCRIDLSDNEDIGDQIVSKFSSEASEVKFAAASAFGNISIGNIEKYLPKIIQQFNEYPARRRLLLHSLKKIITSDRAKLDGPSDEIWSLLMEASKDENEYGTRIIVAECLGKLTLTDITKYLPKLEACLSSDSVNGRATAATAVKYPIMSVSKEYDSLLEPVITKTVNLLTDSDIKIRLVVLLTSNSALRRKPHLIKAQLDHFLSLLYGETVFKEELTDIISMGVWKRTVDHGLDLRNAAFECMDSLLDEFMDKIDVHVYLDTVEKGLGDPEYEIKKLASLILRRLCYIIPTVVAERLERFVDPLQKTLNTKPKSSQGKDEVHQETIRATLSCIAALAQTMSSTVTTIENSRSFEKFDRFVQEVASGPFKDGYAVAASRDGERLPAETVATTDYPFRA